ncbi:dioxygenase, partial [Streptomyces sp. NPDC056728]
MDHTPGAEASGLTEPTAPDELADVTKRAMDRWSTAHSPRHAELMTSLVQHLHAFAREVELTEEEWM